MVGWGDVSRLSFLVAMNDDRIPCSSSLLYPQPNLSPPFPLCPPLHLPHPPPPHPSLLPTFPHHPSPPLRLQAVRAVELRTPLLLPLPFPSLHALIFHPPSPLFNLLPSPSSPLQAVRAVELHTPPLPPLPFPSFPALTFNPPFPLYSL